MSQLRMRGLRILATLLVMIMVGQVSHLTVFAEDGVSFTEEIETEENTETTMMPGESAENEVIDSEEDTIEGTLEDILENTVEDKYKFGKRLNGTPTDITDQIAFDNITLTVSGKELDPDASDNTFPYSYGYQLEIDWSAVDSGYYDANDYFTFSIPDIFHTNQLYDVKDSNTGNVLGSLSFSKEDDGTTTGTITFNKNIEGTTNIKGTLNLTASYLVVEEGETVYWEIQLGETIVKVYEGETEGYVHPNGYAGITESAYKNGSKTSASSDLGDNTYSWYAYFNTQLDNWDAKTTVTDTFVDGTYCLRQYRDRTVDEAKGFFGDSNWSGNNDAYLYIILVDWEAMGNAYNDLVDQADANNETTINPNTEFGLSDIPSYYIRDDNNQLIKYTKGERLPSFMVNVMRTLRYKSGDSIPAGKDAGDYIYMDYFDPDDVDVAITDEGFKIELAAHSIGERSVYLHYYTDITSVVPVSQLTNDIAITFEDEKDPTYESSSTVNVTTTAVVEGEKIPGEIKLYKANRNQNIIFQGVTFTLEDKNNPDKSITVTTDENGVLTFKLSDIMTAPYTGTYILTEASDTTPSGYMCADPIEIELDVDGKVISVNGEAVADNYEGNVLDLVYVLKDHQTLTVYNYLASSPVTINLTGNKTLSGKTLIDSMFGFMVKNENNDIVTTGINKADGSIVFGDILFESEGIYTYTVSEVAGEADGIIYDDAIFTVIVAVEDNGDGTMTATVSYPDGDIEFNNSYKNSERDDSTKEQTTQSTSVTKPSSNTSATKTGDESEMYQWFLLLCASTVVMIAFLRIKRKKHY